MNSTLEKKHHAVALLRSPYSEEQQSEERIGVERRGETRNPVFKPVDIHIGGTVVSGFTSDISNSGIGLTHRKPTGLGPAVIAFTAEEEGVTHEFEIHVEILWTRECSSGWFISGGTLL